MSEIHYAAGLFDGEGYVRIGRRKAQNGNGEVMQVVIGIAMTDPRPLVFMSRRFTGNVNTQARSNPRHRPLHSWMITSRRANEFLLQVLPFLLVKKEEATLAIEFQANIDKWNHKLGNRYGYPKHRDSVFAYRRKLAEEIHRLKSVVRPLVT